MDPFSFAASVLAVVEVVGKVTIAIARYTTSVKEAQESRQRFLVELASLSETLTSLKFLVDDWNQNDDRSDDKGSLASLSTLSGEQGHLAECRTTLEDLLRWLSDEEGGRMTTTRRLMWPFREEKKIKHFLGRLERHKTQFSLALAIVSSKMLGNVQGAVFDVAAEQERVKKEKLREEHEAKRLQYIEHLDPVNYEAKHKNTARVRHKDTCTWLFENPRFMQWRTASSAFLWLYGIPGSGKTVLTSAVIAEMQETIDQGMAVVYFYCDFRDAKAGNTVGVLRTLIAQFLKDNRVNWVQDLPDLSKFAFKGSASLGDVDDLYKVVLKACKLYSRMILIIDALDECTDYPELIPLLLRLHRDASVCVFATSRKEQAIYKELVSLPNISLKDQVRNIDSDIATHVTGELRSKPRLARLPAELKDEIISALLAQSDGMFRWVQCQLDFIANCRTRKGVNEALNNLPKGLYETYERILTNIDKEGTEVSRIAQRSLVWLIAAVRPMALAEVVEAIMIHVGDTCLDEDLRVFEDTDILDICGSLVDYDTVYHVVTLSHFTVKEYLIGGHLKNVSLSHYRISPSDSQRELAELTLTYLLLDCFDDGPCSDLASLKERADVHPLFLYASRFWSYHMAQVSGEDDAFYQCLEDFLLDGSNKHKYLSYRQVHTFFESGRKRLDIGSSITDAGPLWYPIHYGKPWIVRRMLDARPDLVNQEIPSWGTPLMLAAYEDKTEIVRVLLDAGADVDRPSLNFSYNEGTTVCPSYLAVQMNHNAVLDVLLERGADVNHAIAPGDDSLLHCATSQGNLHNVHALLVRGANVTARRSDGCTALHTAVQGGNLDVVRLLVKAGCNAQERTYARRTPLEFAFDLRFAQIIGFLLDNGADVTDVRTLHREDLGWAASEPWFSSVADGLERLQDVSSIKRSPLDVLRVQHLLHKRLNLPLNKAGEILDMAEYWICSESSRVYVEPILVDSQTPQRPFVSVRVRGSHSSTVRRVIFTTKSHDQGWSDEPHNHGTYRWSWTWHDAGRTRGVTNNWDENNSHRRKIHENVHASFTFRVHTTIWDDQDLTPGIREWLEGVAPGDSIHIFPRAAFPGWVNFVESGRIEVYVSL